MSVSFDTEGERFSELFTDLLIFLFFVQSDDLGSDFFPSFGDAWEIYFASFTLLHEKTF